jgi:hypothetical protein
VKKAQYYIIYISTTPANKSRSSSSSSDIYFTFSLCSSTDKSMLRVTRQGISWSHKAAWTLTFPLRMTTSSTSSSQSQRHVLSTFHQPHNHKHNQRQHSTRLCVFGFASVMAAFCSAFSCSSRVSLSERTDSRQQTLSKNFIADAAAIVAPT